MVWDETKQTAVDPESPASNEQITPTDWNDMVIDQKTKLVSGDNISELTNDSGYITGYTVTESDVTTHEGALSITESQISDLGNYIEGVSVSKVTAGSTEPTTPTTGDLWIDLS